MNTARYLQAEKVANDNLLLSVVTVCKDDDKRFAETIYSLFDIYNDDRFEHIIVDGSSDEKICHIINGLVSKRNVTYLSGTDSGIYDAMNRGSSYAQAPLIIYINCGDRLAMSADTLAENMYKILSVARTGNVDIACFPVTYIGSRFTKYCSPTSNLLHKMPVSHQGMVFSSLFVQRHKYVSQFKIAGDFDLYLRAAHVKIFHDKSLPPISYVQMDGLASGNPIRAYQEYLFIAYSRLTGVPRLVSLLLIIIRALIVIPTKSIIPKALIAKIRGI